MASAWEFWIDRGGTFTDCIGVAPSGRTYTAKRLSSETAAAEAIRDILASAPEPSAEDPTLRVRMGTTVATNALLERRGVPTALITQRGLGDVLEIGTQERPELFDLDIRRPPPLTRRVIEVDGRVDARGETLGILEEAPLREELRDARANGIQSVAVLAMHAYAFPELEERIAACAREEGIAYVVPSHEAASELGFLARGETAVADAYLTPLLARHIDVLREALPGARLHFMQSSGGLTRPESFRGPAALLSGPAGGVIGTAHVASLLGMRRAIGFDMGGTSTDVSLVVDGEAERAFESVVAGIRVRAPMLHIHTVAAGGGSLCRFDGARASVGPESAGADPGPLCYGRDASGEGGLALTDVNFWLDRIPGDRLPFPLERAPVAAAFDRLIRELTEAGHEFEPDELAAGFIDIANDAMAQAIQEVSVRRGVDPRDFALVGFGGAGGQHVCAVARKLRIRTVLLHPQGGVLSAFGIGVADLTWDRQRDVGRAPLVEGRADPSVLDTLAALEAEGRRALAAETGQPEGRVEIERFLDLRYRGTESALTIAAPAEGDFGAAFRFAHRERFGYDRSERPIEVTTARVRARVSEARPPEVPSFAEEPGTPIRTAHAWFPGRGRCDAPVFLRESLALEQTIDGPAIVLEAASTIVLDPGFRARLDATGVLVVTDEAHAERRAYRDIDADVADPIRLEVLGNRFMSIAERMGSVLRNTSVSTNIKERLDYSCAVFDPEGGLIANAPHIPVHLGAMGETVRSVLESFPELGAGDVIVTNDPARGGSHLPDVTVVAPVFEEETLRFFVAARGHHADLGGKTPGSMPADSMTLAEEGVLLRAFPLVRGGVLDERRLRAELSGSAFPARNPDDNVADLEAMTAALRSGEQLLRALLSEVGPTVVLATMVQLKEAAARKVGLEIARLGDGRHAFEDTLDDGTPIRVAFEVSGDRMRIDFTGSGAVHPSNLNAPRAVVQSAIIYVLRSLVADRIPLNGGCLDPVEIRLPYPSILDPPDGAAVVGGNVETSQRIVDVLLGAVGRVAASQGTMNNIAFGNDRFGYYETLGGGAGAGEDFDGASGVHTHMTNTRITDPEVLETRYPVILEAFSIRRGSGGGGRHRGGDGLCRAYRFLEPITVSLLTERRTTSPYGMAGGSPGRPGRNMVQRGGEPAQSVAGRATLELDAGDRLRIETPGGGGYGRP